MKYLCEIFWWRGPKQTMGGIAVEINTDRPGWLEWLWRVTDWCGRWWHIKGPTCLAGACWSLLEKWESPEFEATVKHPSLHCCNPQTRQQWNFKMASIWTGKHCRIVAARCKLCSSSDLHHNHNGSGSRCDISGGWWWTWCTVGHTLYSVCEEETHSGGMWSLVTVNLMSDW